MQVLKKVLTEKGITPPTSQGDASLWAGLSGEGSTRERPGSCLLPRLRDGNVVTGKSNSCHACACMFLSIRNDGQAVISPGLASSFVSMLHMKT